LTTHPHSHWGVFFLSRPTFSGVLLLHIWWLFFLACPPAAPWSPPVLGQAGFENRFPTRSIADGVFFPAVFPRRQVSPCVSEFDGPSFPLRETLWWGSGPGAGVLSFRGPRSYATIASGPSCLATLSGDCRLTFAPGRGLPAFQTQSGWTGTGTMEAVTSSPPRAQRRSSLDASWPGVVGRCYPPSR